MLHGFDITNLNEKYIVLNLETKGYSLNHNFKEMNTLIDNQEREDLIKKLKRRKKLKDVLR